MTRLGAIDAVRGLAVVLMVMHHCVDSWTRGTDRAGPFWHVLRHLGGVPAPAFLVLAGVSAALVLSRERDRAVPRRTRALGALRRGLYVLGIAFAYRVFAFVVDGNPLSAWEMIFRVDILNCMGVALALVGVPVALARTRAGSACLAVVLFAAFLLASPWVFGAHLEWPSPLAGNYVAGTGRLVLFPLLPWAAFLAAGLVIGEAWAHVASRLRDPAAAGRRLAWSLPLGLAVFVGAWALSKLPWSFAPRHDFVKASPHFVLMRLGVQLALLGLAALLVPLLPRVWQRRSPLQLLGRHSLLVYLVHLELAYGSIAWALKRRLPVGAALAGTAVVTVFCGLLAWAAERRMAAGSSVATRSAPGSVATTTS